MISRQGYAETAVLSSYLLLGGVLGPCLAFFQFLFAFWGLFGRILRHLVFGDAFLRFLSIFHRFWMDFGRILGRFSDDFWQFFRKKRKRVEANKTLRGRMNFEGRLFKKCAKFATKLQKTMQIYDQKKTSKKIA